MDKRKIKQQISDIFNNAVNPFFGVIDNLEKIQKGLENKNSILSSKVGKLKDEILILKKEKDSFKLFKGLNSRLVKNIDKHKVEILSLCKQTEEVKKEKAKTIFDLDTEISNKKAEQESLLKLVIPSLTEVKKRTKELDIKEVDLKIIESRYKKLYAAKGVSFKV